jgi:hypothetical protein
MSIAIPITYSIYRDQIESRDDHRKKTIYYGICITQLYVLFNILKQIMFLNAIIEVTFSIISILLLHLLVKEEHIANIYKFEDFRQSLRIISVLMIPHLFITLIRNTFDTYQIGMWIFSLSSTLIYSWQILMLNTYILSGFFLDKFEKKNLLNTIFVLICLLAYLTG